MEAAKVTAGTKLRAIWQALEKQQHGQQQQDASASAAAGADGTSLSSHSYNESDGLELDQFQQVIELMKTRLTSQQIESVFGCFCKRRMDSGDGSSNGNSPLVVTCDSFCEALGLGENDDMRAKRVIQLVKNLIEGDERASAKLESYFARHDPDDTTTLRSKSAMGDSLIEFDREQTRKFVEAVTALGTNLSNKECLNLLSSLQTRGKVSRGAFPKLLLAEPDSNDPSSSTSSRTKQPQAPLASKVGSLLKCMYSSGKVAESDAVMGGAKKNSAAAHESSTSSPPIGLRSPLDIQPLLREFFTFLKSTYPVQPQSQIHTWHLIYDLKGGKKNTPLTRDRLMQFLAEQKGLFEKSSTDQGLFKRVMSITDAEMTRLFLALNKKNGNHPAANGATSTAEGAGGGGGGAEPAVVDQAVTRSDAISQAALIDLLGGPSGPRYIDVQKLVFFAEDDPAAATAAAAYMTARTAAKPTSGAEGGVAHAAQPSLYFRITTQLDGKVFWRSNDRLPVSAFISSEEEGLPIIWQAANDVETVVIEVRPNNKHTHTLHGLKTLT